jgi:hypothetical protein
MLKYKIRERNINVEKNKGIKMKWIVFYELCFISWCMVKALSFLVYTITHTHTTRSLLLNSAKFNQLV